MKLPVLSGQEVVKILSKYGFSIVDQKGSHVIMQRVQDGEKRKAVVPLHKELAKGTLLSILKQAGLSKEELRNSS